MNTLHPHIASGPRAGTAYGRISGRHPRGAIVLAAAAALGISLAGCWSDASDAPAAPGSTYSLGGSVVGLTTTGLVLVNGTDSASPVAGATSFNFPTPLATGSSYGVSVQTQPANATCVVNGGSGTVGTAAVSDVTITCMPLAFTVGGSITGLAAAGLVLANGIDMLAVASGATGFTLPTAVAHGTGYTVTVRTQPAGEHCSLTNSTGAVAGASVTNVAVACAAVSHSLGGTISRLPSAGLVLANGSDTVRPVAGALAFSFSIAVAEGGAYAVSVQTQPSGATCSIGSGTGTMGTSDIASVQVTCAANAYRLSGTIAGLTASGLILANGTDTVSPPADATAFAFARTVAFEGSYSLTVQQQPAGLNCAVAGSFPATIGAGDVTDLAVTCAPANSLTPLAGQLTCPNSGPCIFQKKAVEFDSEVILIVVVRGCGQVGRGRRGGQREALSTASGPVRAIARTVHLSTAPRLGSFRGRCAKPDWPMSIQLAG